MAGWLFQVEVVRGCIYDLSYINSPEDPNQPRDQMDIVFFHGLQPFCYKDAYKTTWISPTNNELWPGTWLAQHFPRARVLSVSYNSLAIYSREDLDDTATHLAQQLIVGAQVGGDGRPTVLVGHSLGGLVIKKICEEARRRSDEEREEIFGTFLRKSLRGVFFYATPHGGAPLAATLKKCLGCLIPFSPAMALLANSLATHVFTDISTRFNAACQKYRWETLVLGEGLPISFLVNPNLVFIYKFGWLHCGF